METPGQVGSLTFPTPCSMEIRPVYLPRPNRHDTVEICTTSILGFHGATVVYNYLFLLLCLILEGRYLDIQLDKQIAFQSNMFQVNIAKLTAAFFRPSEIDHSMIINRKSARGLYFKPGGTKYTYTVPVQIEKVWNEVNLTRH